MAKRLSAWKPQAPFVTRDGRLTPEAARHLNDIHAKLGLNQEAIPVSAGGSGATNIAAAIAIQAAATVVAGAPNQPQNITVTLNRPVSASAGATADTPVTWPTAFTDNNYTPTVAFLGAGGELSIIAQTATGLTLRLENTDDGFRASGRAECTGVHA